MEKDIGRRAKKLMFYYSVTSNSLAESRRSNSKIRHFILLFYVLNLQILIMEWQNAELQINQFSEHTATTEKSNSPPFLQLLLI